MNTKMNVTVFVVALALMTAGIVNAQQRRGHFKGERLFERLSGQLSLSEEQQAEIKQIIDSAHEEMAPHFEKMKALRKEMKALWDNENLDEDAIMAVHKKMHALKGKIGELRLEMKIDIYSRLSSDQKVKAKKMFRNHFGKKGKHWGRWGKGQKGNRGQGNHGFGVGHWK